MIPCYEFINIIIKDVDMQARPTGWDREIYDNEGNDRFGVQVKPTTFETVCPFCANLVSFDQVEIYESPDGAKNNVKCSHSHCEAGNPGIDKTKVYKAEFSDPIAAGLFGDEIDFKRLKKIDASFESGEAV